MAIENAVLVVSAVVHDSNMYVWKATLHTSNGGGEDAGRSEATYEKTVPASWIVQVLDDKPKLAGWEPYQWRSRPDDPGTEHLTIALKRATQD